MLLVDDDQSQVPKRSKNSGTGADEDVKAALFNSFPDPVFFSPCKPAVPESHLLPQCSFEPGACLRCQGDLRHQIQHLVPMGNCGHGGAQIYLRLSASGYTME